MTELYSWMPQGVWDALGQTLIHFLWQGALLAALLHIILPLCRSAAGRHNCALATLVLMMLAPIVTFVSIHDLGASSAGAFATGAPVSAFAWMKGVVAFWLAGIAVLSLRAMGGWYLARSLGRHGTLAVPAELLQRCQNLQRRLGVAWPTRFLLSRRIGTPMVIGWLRPVVLIPLSAITGLAPAQLDALILHELAHIRRLDTLINILLAAAETLLFYHPLVWWVCRQVRIEREHCCDDRAVVACGDAAMYVEALAALPPWNPAGMALAANGGSLKSRAARLLGRKHKARRPSLPTVTGLVLLGLLAGAVAMAQTAIPARPAKASSAYLSNDKNPVMLQPIQETHTLPPYPKQSVHLKEQGRVILAVTVGTNGAVSRAAVVKPSGYQRLDNAALQFVKSHWRWQPAMRIGKPVAAKTRVSVLFKLRHPQPQQSY